MGKYVVGYIACALTMVALDAIWLGLVAPDLYGTALGHLMAERPNFVAAIAFYVLYVVGVLIFAVAPALAAGTWKKAALLGGLFGFFAYMTYDLTNLATLRNWPLNIVFIDIAWGIFITGAASIAGYGAMKKAGGA